MRKVLFFVFTCGVLGVLSAQTVVTGKVTESATGTPIPFANVIFSGTSDGTITDFEGNFVATTSLPVDSLEVRYIGFVRKAKSVKRGGTQVVDFQLEEDLVTLGEVIVYAGENPAFPILRNVVDHKKNNDRRSLNAYEYEGYTKIEIDVDNISSKLKERKFVSKITDVIDSIEVIAGEDGLPILPIFFSEAISRFYYRSNPTFRHEHMIKTKVSGVGITDGTTSSQVVGASFQQYNFYQNWMTIISKEFVSPIADSWKLYYEYELVDSLFLGDDYCYRIDFFPKRAQDLAFVGTMWIAKQDYGLKRIDATVPKAANINFVEKLKIQQDLLRTEAGPWLPEKTRVVVDVIQVTDFTAGFLAKFYISTKDHVVNQPMDKSFYLNPVTMEEDMTLSDENYWSEMRHDSLTETEVSVFEMIDTLKNIPQVKFWTNAAKFAFSGYYRVGKLDIGPHHTFLGKNDVEGLRLGFGGRSTIAFSKKWTIGGYVGYGFGDDLWKYRVYVDRILSRSPWFTVRAEYQKEVEQIWLLNENLEPKSFFFTLSRFGNLTQPFLIEKRRLAFDRQMSAGLSFGLSLKQERFEPLFPFNYYTSPERDQTSSAFDISEVGFSARYAKDEVFIMDDNSRVSLGTIRWPAFNLDYTYGAKGVLGSDFEYHKIKASVEKKQKMYLLGVGEIKITGGFILGEVPYPLLYNPIGNQTPAYVGFAYNLMDYFEFTTDKFVELRYKHSFEGLFLNSIPLIKKLKFRELASLDVLFGDVSEEKINLAYSTLDGGGTPQKPFSILDGRPYVEVGYGVENIARVLTVQAFHRLTYLDAPNVNKFGVKFKVELNL